MQYAVDSFQAMEAGKPYWMPVTFGPFTDIQLNVHALKLTPSADWNETIREDRRVRALPPPLQELFLLSNDVSAQHLEQIIASTDVDPVGEPGAESVNNLLIDGVLDMLVTAGVGGRRGMAKGAMPSNAGKAFAASPDEPPTMMTIKMTERIKMKQERASCGPLVGQSNCGGANALPNNATTGDTITATLCTSIQSINANGLLATATANDAATSDTVQGLHASATANSTSGNWGKI
ncbi:hypothetical protein F5887DRAFT_915869 [Amanita rubescens]|nr:hypothetical protein F5887DRAFT_915869 [Amanita rubescens]